MRSHCQAADVEKRGAKSLAFKADVAEDAECRAMVSAAERAFAQLDVLVNNAGTTSFIPHANLEAITGDDWSRILQVNLVGPFQCARAAQELFAPLFGRHATARGARVLATIPRGHARPYCPAAAPFRALRIPIAERTRDVCVFSDNIADDVFSGNSGHGH